MCNSKPKVVTVQEPAPKTNTNSNNLGSGSSSSSSNSTTTPAPSPSPATPTPEPVQESGSAMKKYRKAGLAGRNTNTGARGLGTNADSAKKELLGG